MRNCDDCGVCCTGVLPGEAHGKEFYLNNPCYYLKDKRCSIYNDNMPAVCKKYRCAWLDDETIPDNLDPRITNSLMMKTRRHLTKTESQMTVFIDSDNIEHENAFIEYARSKKITLVMQLLQQNKAKVVQEDGQIQILG